MTPCLTCGHDCGGYGCHIPGASHEHGLGCMQRVIADQQERAALDAAWQQHRDHLIASRSGHGAAFDAGWQARGAYERARMTALIDAIGRIAERRMGICPLCDMHWNYHGMACPIRAALAEPSTAPEEQR